MSWSNLTLSSGWTVAPGYPAARVRPLSGISGAAQLEGYLVYSGSALVDVPVTNEASLPAGTFDPSGFHSIEGRCYTGNSGFLGACELLVTEDGTLSANPLPPGTHFMFFGSIYPVS